MSLLVPLHAFITVLADPSPEPEDVKAGKLALALFLLLALAVVLLGFSLVKHLRKAQAAQDAGVFGPVESTDSKATDHEATDHEATDQSPGHQPG